MAWSRPSSAASAIACNRSISDRGHTGTRRDATQRLGSREAVDGRPVDLDGTTVLLAQPSPDPGCLLHLDALAEDRPGRRFVRGGEADWAQARKLVDEPSSDGIAADRLGQRRSVDVEREHPLKLSTSPSGLVRAVDRDPERTRLALVNADPGWLPVVLHRERQPQRVLTVIDAAASRQGCEACQEADAGGEGELTPRGENAAMRRHVGPPVRGQRHQPGRYRVGDGSADAGAQPLSWTVMA